MPEPHTHYFEVKMNVSNYEKDYFDIQMPVWAPGSYLVREFAKSVEDVNASFNKKLIGPHDFRVALFYFNTNCS